MASIPRLMKYSYHDHATAKERLLFTQRRSWYRNKLLWWPVIFFACWLLWGVSKADTVVWGKKGTTAYVVTIPADGPLLRFEMRLTERR